MKVAVVGASGFVGSAVVEALRAAGHEAVPVRAPRLPADGRPADAHRAEIERCVEEFTGADAVVNASGNPDASLTDQGALDAANAVSPAVTALASERAGVPRFVYVSSAVVQGRLPVLDETEATDAFSPYARSKVNGEQQVRTWRPDAVVYRPPSVHAASRRVTRMTVRIARSPLATVAAPGDQPSPQALIQNVAAALVHLATTSSTPDPIVIHPWEGLTSAGLMEALGGKAPRVIPRPLARAIVAAGERLGTIVPAVGPNARRVEMLWFGQGQAASWLVRDGWTPPVGHEGWAALGAGE